MPVVHNLHGAGDVSKQEGVVHHVGIVGRVGIPGPLEIPEAAPIARVVASFVRPRRKCLADDVRQNGNDTVRAGNERPLWPTWHARQRVLSRT